MAIRMLEELPLSQMGKKKFRSEFSDLMNFPHQLEQPILLFYIYIGAAFIG